MNELTKELHSFYNGEFMVKIVWDNKTSQFLPENETLKLEHYRLYYYKRSNEHVHIDKEMQEVIKKLSPIEDEKDLDLNINWTYRLIKYYDSKTKEIINL